MHTTIPIVGSSEGDIAPIARDAPRVRSEFSIGWHLYPAELRETRPPSAAHLFCRRIGVQHGSRNLRHVGRKAVAAKKDRVEAERVHANEAIALAPADGDKGSQTGGTEHRLIRGQAGE